MQCTVHTEATLEMIVLAGGERGWYLWLQANTANASCCSAANLVSGYCHWSNCWSNHLKDLLSNRNGTFKKHKSFTFLSFYTPNLWNMSRWYLMNLLQALSAVRGLWWGRNPSRKPSFPQNGGHSDWWLVAMSHFCLFLDDLVPLADQNRQNLSQHKSTIWRQDSTSSLADVPHIRTCCIGTEFQFQHAIHSEDHQSHCWLVPLWETSWHP